MTTHLCIDCDSPGDGNCSVCHGSGKIEGVMYATASGGGDGGELTCSACGGTGSCSKCEGSGEIEVGGEA